MSNSSYKLSQSVRTAAEAKRLLQNLDQVIATIHSSDNKYEEVSKALSTKQRQLLIEDLQSNNTTITDPAAQPVITDIRAAIMKMPVATVELAFQPSALFAEEIAESINSMTKTPCIIEIKNNPSIGGGISIYLEGRHYDYSLSDKFNEFSKI